MIVKPQMPHVPRKKIALGDAVAAVAQPIARVLHINPGCKPCAARKDWLNAKVPNINPLAPRQTEDEINADEGDEVARWADYNHEDLNDGT